MVFCLPPLFTPGHDPAYQALDESLIAVVILIGETLPLWMITQLLSFPEKDFLRKYTNYHKSWIEVGLSSHYGTAYTYMYVYKPIVCIVYMYNIHIP